jgi:hypothetical protein
MPDVTHERSRRPGAWRRLVAGAALLALGACAPSGGRAGRILLEETFDRSPGTELARILLSNTRVSPAPGAGPDGSDAIRIAYPPHGTGSQGVVKRIPLEAAVAAATLSFDVCFERDFQWVRGGKLPGLGPAEPLTGGAARTPSGWSARIMFQPEGRCSTYLYDQNPAEQWGVGHLSPEPVFAAGRWHRVEFLVKLNAPGRSDGFACIRVDGVEVARSAQVEFRGTDTEATQIRQLLFSTFHGGDDSTWTPVDAEGNPITMHALFDNIRVVEGI